jgi:hypothetical protein
MYVYFGMYEITNAVLIIVQPLNSYYYYNRFKKMWRFILVVQDEFDFFEKVSIVNSIIFLSYPGSLFLWEQIFHLPLPSQMCMIQSCLPRLYKTGGSV